MTHESAPGTGLKKAGSTKIGHAHRNDGRTLGRSIAFQRTDSKLFLKSQGQTFRQFLRAGQDQSKRAQLSRGATSHVKLQEGGCGQQNGHPVAMNEITHRRSIQRVGLHGHGQSLLGGKPKTHIAKGMKQGQNPQHPVLGGGPQNLGDAFNIGIDVGMGQHDAFGFPRTSAAEDHGRHVIRPDTPGGTTQFFQHALGQEVRSNRARKFGQKADPGGQILYPDQIDPLRHLQIELFLKGAAGDDRFQSSLAHGRLHTAFPNRVIQIDTGAPRQGGGKIDQSAGNGGRQKDPDLGLLGPLRFESSRQGDGTHQGLEAGDTRLACIGESQSKGPSPGPAHKGTMQRTPLFLPVGPGG